MSIEFTDTPAQIAHSGRQQLLKGILAVMPLCIAVVPWGILAGSFAIEAGLSTFEAQAMSAILFAGSAQLVAVGMFKAGVGIGTLLLTTFFITSRHLLYSVSLRDRISTLPLRWRLILGFWLTDELFAVCANQSQREFNKWYALGAGGAFYVVWNLATFAGIVAGNYIPGLTEAGLDFAVAATFIALVVPGVKSYPVLAAVIVSLVISVLCTHYQIEGALMIASIAGMLTGYWCESVTKQKQNSTDHSTEGEKQ
ncbi:AzlC family ABC transporter permease [Vibrio sp. SCSIO 43137]|uniref:AzlC family ABC transporter permease n=1 Tax=Vibrio sp. SCSIO 43137 TaxID=3021011 RepID=UPI0023077FA7|nr:AzlC family ABC transporter permease [Vibrio sp. SCSIO 43137]WCE32228.1 AzlC family ABC transporter permease [Vibrio sp. SCSIO 43137]